MPSDMTFRKEFWSWGEALKVAGFTPIKYLPSKPKWAINKKGVSRIISKQWYVLLFKPNHCESMKNWYVREHRMIMSDYLWRKLRNTEQIHHKNKNKEDNRLENLQLITIWEHSTLHHKWKNKPRKKQNNCFICWELTWSKYCLCNKHYKLQWQRVKNKLIGNIYKNPELLENNN